MHNFASIQEFARFKTVAYYTVKWENASLSETDDFLARMKKELMYEDQFQQLLKWIAYLGNRKKGAEFDFFRQENHCVALPPSSSYLREPIDVRLYCHWVSTYIVILYNGGIKTTRVAQDCPNVSRHFYNAQSWTKQLLAIGVEHYAQRITNIEELYIKF